MLGYRMPRALLGPKNAKRDPYAVAISGADVINVTHECKKRDPYAVALSGTDPPRPESDT